MSIEHGRTPVQEELPFNPLAKKDWSELSHTEAQKHLTDLARRGDDIHDITMPQELPKGADLVRAVMAGTIQIEEGPEEPDELPVAKTPKSVAQPDLSGREAAGHIDAALRTAEARLGRRLTDQESVHVASKAEYAVRNGQ